MAFREPRRYLFACGTDQYTFRTEENRPLSSLDKVQEDIERMARLLSRRFGYERILNNISINPTKEQLQDGWEDWLQSPDLNRNDCLIFYYAGHGLTWENGQHHLILQKTQRLKFASTALPTDSLIKPLFNPDVILPKVLYIIDTCESAEGAYDLLKEAFNLQRIQPIDSDNSVVIQAIASCRSRQYAQDGAFPKAFEAAVGEILSNRDSGYIYLDELMPGVGNKIGNSGQECRRIADSGKGAISFFPIHPETIRTWEDRRKTLVRELLHILSLKKEFSVFSVNSFVLGQDALNLYSRTQLGVEGILNELSIRQVTDGICPLVACSEWCRIIFSELASELDIGSRIQSWQQEVAKYRVDLDLDQIRRSVRQEFAKLKEKLQDKELRLQISLEPEYDPKNTGQPTGNLFVSTELYVQDTELPLGRFSEREPLRLSTTDETDPLCRAFEENSFLSNLVQLVLDSIYIGFGMLNELVIEIFLPIEYYLSPIDTVKIQYGDCEDEIGKQYPVIINSYQRYFDRGSLSVRRDIDIKKRKLWKEANPQPQICNESDKGTSEVRKFKPYEIFKGALPSKHLLKMIERDLPIAVWCRNSKHPLQKDDQHQLPVESWSNWPKQLYDLRNSINNSDVTLFWDDLSPKPKYPKPLNIGVVKK